MTELEMFFADNVEEVEEVSFTPSLRFKDKDGNPLAWKLKPLSPADNDKIKRQCMKRIRVVGNKGQFTEEFDQFKYALLLTVKTVTFPDLNNAQLQASWSKKAGFDIMTPEDLLQTMLTAGELDELTNRCTEVSGYDDINEDVETAKN